MSKQFTEVSPNVFASLETGNVYQFEEGSYSRTKPNTINIQGRKVIQWGSDNKLPYLNRRILAENDIKQNLVNTDVDITAGQYLYLYTERIEADKRIQTPVDDVELMDWMEQFRIHEFFSETIQDIKEFGNSWTEFILSRDRSKVTSMISQDAVDCRLQKIEPGSGRKDSKTLLMCDWKNASRMNDNEVESVPLLDIRNPQFGRDGKVALHIKKIISGMPYYTLVDWYGTKEWAEIANIVPKFHKQGIKNGYMLRYHVKIPLSYFEGKITADKTLEEVKIEVQERLDEVLGSADSSHKAFFSIINDKLQLSSQQLSEWKFEKIETDLKDESYLKLHEHASTVHARGHNIDPALAGIQTEGRLSAGAEIRNLLNYHIAYKTQRVRRLAMNPINLVKDFNFPDKKNIKIGVGDVEFTTTDANPSGMQNTQSNG